MICLIGCADNCVDVESTTSLAHFFALLELIVRIINTVLISKGSNHEHTLRSARDFVTQNRPFVVSIFKRNAAIGGSVLGMATNGGKGIDLSNLVDGFTLLLSATNFLQVSDKLSFHGK